MRVLGIAGSLRRGSHNARLLRAAAGALPPGVELVVWDGLRDVPAYDADLDVEPAPRAVDDLREAIASADAVLIATPEYNGSIPGVLKNAIDWASRPFPDNSLRDRRVAVIGATTGLFGAIWAQADARRVLGIAGARVLEDELPVGQADTAFSDDDRLADPAQAAALESIVARLVSMVAQDAAAVPVAA